VIITPLFPGQIPRAMKNRRLYDEWTAEPHLYNIMLASLGTTPLKIIYAGRLEYACVCVCKFCGVNETCGERCGKRASDRADEFF
jgi:hypothetical protein